MAPRTDVEFRVTFPLIVHPTFTDWLQRYGIVAQTRLSVDGTTHTVDIVCKGFYRQDALQQSFRAKLTSAGMAFACDHVHVRSMPTLTTQELVDRLRSHLRLCPAATVVPLHNFGQEDTGYVTPSEYVGKTLAGLRLLLADVYFHDDRKQNHTARLNVDQRAVEVHQNGDWTPLAIPVAFDRMVGACRSLFLQGFDRETHKSNDTVMDFMVTLCSPATEGALKADIMAGLVKRRNNIDKN